MRRRRRLQLIAAAPAVAIAVTAVLVVRASADPDRLAAARTPVTQAAPPATLPPATLPGPRPSQWLRAAEAAYRRSRAWWDPRRGWYLKFLPGYGRGQLVTLWHVVHLFSAASAIAIADPTPRHLAAARWFANEAEHYWNPTLGPVPGYSPGYKVLDPTVMTWYDDDAWWGVAFFDAFRATGDRRYLRDAGRALAFVNSGWDPRRGGIYWDVHRTFKSSESLAGATLTAASLYGETHNPRYLTLARRYIGWANRHIRGRDGLYGGRATPATPMPYVEGPMAEAMIRLCGSTGRASYCAAGEQLMQRAADRFPVLTMGPQYDSIYIRSVLEIYRLDHNPRWYAIAQKAGEQVLANAADAHGLLLRSWQGKVVSSQPPGSLQIHGASTSVLAWLAAATGRAARAPRPAPPRTLRRHVVLSWPARCRAASSRPPLPDSRQLAARDRCPP